MAVAELSNILKKVSDSSGQFKQTASENNKNVSKITKDLSNVVFSQKKEISELSSSIQESISTNTQTSSKIEQTNSLLQESISIQNNMLSQLKSIASSLKNKDNDSSGSLSSMLSKWKSILPGAAAIGGGAIIANEASKQSSGSGGIDLNKKFSELSEEEKNKFLEKQTKAEGVRSELNNPGAIQFGEHAKKFGAEAGPNNGTITLSKFPSMEKGKEAHRALWESPKYANLPLNQGLNKWVTGDENKPAPETYKDVFTRGSAKPGSEENDGKKGDSGKKEGKGSEEGLATITSKDGQATKVAAEYASNFQGFIDELEASGYKIKNLSGFADRNIAGTNTPSWHSKGMAIDINPGSNPVTYGESGRTPQTDMPGNVDKIAEKYGLGWGGKWDGKKQDAMHFSLGEGPGAIFRGQGVENASKNGGQTPGGTAGGETPQQAPGGKTPESSGSKPSGGVFSPGDFMGGNVIPFEPKRGNMGMGGGLGLFGNLISSLIPSEQSSSKEDGPRPQTTAAKGSFTPTFAAPGSSEDTSANFFAADKANTAKLLKEKATEETVRKQRAEEATVAKTEAPKEQTQEQQASGKSSPAPFKPDHEMFGKGDWAGDLLRYFGVKSSIA
jgi:hypothetical protein